MVDRALAFSSSLTHSLSSSENVLNVLWAVLSSCLLVRAAGSCLLN